MSPLRIALSLVGIAAVIIAAYISTAYLSTRTQKMRSGKNIWVRERFALSKDKSIFLFEIQGKVYMIAVTNQAIALLDTFDAALFTDEGLTREPFKKFSSYLASRGGLFGGKNSDQYEYAEDSLDTIYKKIKNGRPSRGDDEA